jgi:molecular chaperone Hsp33
MQSNIKFNGALVLQIFGDGPVKLAVAEVQPDLSLRATAKVVGDVALTALSQMVNVATTRAAAPSRSTPKTSTPASSPTRAWCRCLATSQKSWASCREVLEHYMLQSEQLDTTLVLAANDKVAAGLLIQRLPTQGEEPVGSAGARQRRPDWRQ